MTIFSPHFKTAIVQAEIANQGCASALKMTRRKLRSGGISAGFAAPEQDGQSGDNNGRRYAF
jgi:hypothetical protein